VIDVEALDGAPVSEWVDVARHGSAWPLPVIVYAPKRLSQMPGRETPPRLDSRPDGALWAYDPAQLIGCASMLFRHPAGMF